MALGHVWTTQSVTETQLRDRASARRSLLQHRADAKGQLVDLLLQRGMLKIDAMSMADTLEGYPDLFVSALLGEALVTHDSAADGRQSRGYSEQDFDFADESASTPPSVLYAPSMPRLSETSLLLDPVTAAVSQAASDARKEALCMMLGFGLFSLVPSLVLHGVVLLFQGDNVDHIQDDAGFAMSAHPNVLSMILIGSVMWVLGVWKSRFVDSHWLVYAVETVVVWMLCLACAYFVGSLLKAVLLTKGFTLQVMPAVASASHAIQTTSRYTNP